MYPANLSPFLISNGPTLNAPRNPPFPPAIIIGNLPTNINEEMLFDAFRGFGIIEDIQIKRSPVLNDSTYAYVRFQLFEFAQAAINSCQGRIFLDRPLRVIWAHEFEVPQQQYPPSAPSGPILPLSHEQRRQIDIPRFSSPLAMELNSYSANPSSNLSISAPLSTFVPGPMASINPVSTMRSQLDLSLKSYNQSRVEPPAVNRTHPPSKKKDKKLETAQVHFSYVTNRPATVTIEELRNVFSHFGTVIDVAVKKSNVNKATFTQTGYGFIHFPLTSEGVTAAVETAKHMEGMVLDSVKYSCSLSHGLKSIVDRSSAALDPPAPLETVDDLLSNPR